MNCSGNKSVLLITGKFPDVSPDMDGGSIMMNHLIEALCNQCSLDVIFTRTNNAKFVSIEGVRCVTFHTNRFKHNNKFIRRLANAEWNSSMFSALIPQYDSVIIVHCSKAFGLETLPTRLLNKIVLFPMYLSSSYQRSGEDVPSEYTEAEKRILPLVAKIITPSLSERNDIINDYGVLENKIVVIPRAMNRFVESRARTHSQANRILYVGTIKKQKRNDEAISLLYQLKLRGVNAHLYLVGSIQDKELYAHCIDLAKKFELENAITFCGVLSQSEVATLMNNVDINLSVSRWETFGRGVFEGLCAGLPTVVYKHVECLSEHPKMNNGVLYVENIEEMIDKIYELCTNSLLYKMQSEEALLSNYQFSIEKQNERILQEVLYEL